MRRWAATGLELASDYCASRCVAHSHRAVTTRTPRAFVAPALRALAWGATAMALYAAAVGARG